jgi:Spy/CpxP family protein refolding chaperone
MKRFSLITGATLAALVLLAAQSAFAERGFPGHGPRGPMAGMGAEFMFEALDLTPEQRATVDSIGEAYRPRLRALRESGRGSREALMNTAPDDENYAAVVDQASLDAGANAAELVRLMAALRSEVYAVLTTEQRAAALELRGKMRKRFQERKERRRSRSEPWSDQG